jgi:hypothetical protein
MNRYGRAWQNALVFIAAALFLVSCDLCPSPPLECPFDVTLTVATPSGGTLTGVEATVSGSPLTCDSTPTGATCVGGGDGQLHVEAPGFQPIDVDSTVTRTPAPACGCPGFTRDPSNVTLNPS